MPDHKPEISLVVPCFNEVGNLNMLTESIHKILEGESYEIVFVDDGSKDETLEHIKKLAKKDSRIHYVSFSRNFGHQAALRAGLQVARGEAVISMDADMQHPPKLIPVLLKKWRAGFEIVNTIRQKGEHVSKFKQATSGIFYRIINLLSGLNIQNGSADFRLLNRKVVDMINDQQESDLFLRGYISWIGFNQTTVEYTPGKRYSGKTKYSLKKMVSLASSGITQFSIKPLRIAYVLSIFAFLIGLIYGVYAMWLVLFTESTVQGWASLVVLFIFLQGFQFLLLGLIGEYLGKTFMQTKHRPEFIVREKA